MFLPRKFFARASLSARFRIFAPSANSPADVDVGQVHVVRVAGDDHALEHLVRVLVDDLLVLEGARLRFVRIADQVDRLAALAVHERPLQPAGKAGAAAAAQARNHDLLPKLLRAAERLAVRQRLGRKRQGLLEHLVAAMPQIALQVRRVARLVGVLENLAVFLRHISSLTPGWKSLRLSARRLARWCNGSTADSGSVCHGSNPCRAANLPLRSAECGVRKWSALICTPPESRPPSSR